MRLLQKCRCCFSTILQKPLYFGTGLDSHTFLTPRKASEVNATERKKCNDCVVLFSDSQNQPFGRENVITP